MLALPAGPTAAEYERRPLINRTADALTCSGEKRGGPRQVAGVVDSTKEAGARGSTQKLGLEAEV